MAASALILKGTLQPLLTQLVQGTLLTQLPEVFLLPPAVQSSVWAAATLLERRCTATLADVSAATTSASTLAPETSTRLVAGSNLTLFIYLRFKLPVLVGVTCLLEICLIDFILFVIIFLVLDHKT